LNPSVNVSSLKAEDFQTENSGSGSSVSFVQLGIRDTQVTRIALSHPDADITGGTTEIPGDVVLIKDENTLLFSACNVYFEAQRQRP
jgi:hypothetical protein